MLCVMKMPKPSSSIRFVLLRIENYSCPWVNEIAQKLEKEKEKKSEQ